MNKLSPTAELQAIFAEDYDHTFSMDEAEMVLDALVELYALLLGCNGV